MIGRLNGKLIEKNPTDLLIECGGVGYEVKISLNTFTSLSDNESICIYTKLIVREDAQILYGFNSKEEREMFNQLISVSGIGPNTAMIMLSSLTPTEIAHAIQSENVTLIQSVKGIGAKTAQRVIVDLKGKSMIVESSVENITEKSNTIHFDALSALVSLGFDKRAAEKALNKANVENATLESLIKEALKVL
ncbi:MAG: Holliday junction branch migration protein RuvA [Crocinitomicaceae bacterium]|nr:Holliday junction branch migration protein RuvA [Crocinitomicaceae bacterium]|tara:strand:+ start:214 stop:789 length:576 start_codon:yes stop_codon:yes gene_type:complete